MSGSISKITFPDGTEYVLTQGKTYWRVKNDQETDKWLGDGGIRAAAPAPAVWIVGDRAFQMTKDVQRFCADILAFSKYGYPFGELPTDLRHFIASAFTGLFASDRALSNKSGFPAKNDPTPRKNYIDPSPDDVDELPRFDKIRVCSGNLITGVVDGTDLVVDHFTEVPEYIPYGILDDPRVIWASIIRTDGTLQNFPQLDGAPVLYPLMSNHELRMPLKYLQRMD